MTYKIFSNFQKMCSKKLAILVIPIFVGLFTANSATAQYGRPANVIVPAWAPYYDNPASVHYYYFPDYEIYFDVWANEFIYLENGRWLFSPILPPYIGNIDLYSAYVVLINDQVYQPWLHYDVYLSHYPRYYYRTLPTYKNGMRGYNENGRKMVIIDNNRPNERRDNNNPMVNPSNRQPQDVQYRGSNVGKPVTVQPNMRNPQDPKFRGQGNDNNRDSGRHKN